MALGFAGVDTDHHGAPSKDELDDLIEKDKHSPEKVWRAVILRGVARHVHLQIPKVLRGPDGLVAWVEADAARSQQLLRQADEQISNQGLRVLVVFDALDRLGDDWRQIRERTRALLQVTLAFRAYRAIRPKLFLRVDQAEDASLAAFPDASKLLSAGARVDLTWEFRDLYGLLYTLLLQDAEAGPVFANLISNATGFALANGPALPAALKDQEQAQKRVFVGLAGEYMGVSKTKGHTYTWLPKHLADARQRTSPRTFLEAIRVAATHRASSSANVPLPPTALRAGIQAASELRLQQLKEEYGWIEDVIAPLADQQVPCRDTDLFARWDDAHTLSAIATPHGRFLEPIEFSDTESPQTATILKALLRIGVAEPRADGRINIPDIYRVAAKMLRKGGVTPKR
ncbi:MAG: hypothetical protein ACSLE9_12340 [Burkholderiaceae bacterium]